MQKYMTTSEKDRKRPYLLKRDGPNCIFCHEPFVVNDRHLKMSVDHLDNNKFNHEDWNLALVHWKCNQHKKSFPEYQMIAQAKIKENVDTLGECVHAQPEPKTTSKEIDIHVIMGKLTKEFLDERLLTKGKPALDLNDTANSIAYLLYNQTGHGSPATAKRHIQMFCASVAPYKLEEQAGAWVIVKRQ